MHNVEFKTVLNIVSKKMEKLFSEIFYDSV